MLIKHAADGFLSNMLKGQSSATENMLRSQVQPLTSPAKEFQAEKWKGQLPGSGTVLR